MQQLTQDQIKYLGHKDRMLLGQPAPAGAIVEEAAKIAYYKQLRKMQDMGIAKLTEPAGIAPLSDFQRAKFYSALQKKMSEASDTQGVIDFDALIKLVAEARTASTVQIPNEVKKIMLKLKDSRGQEVFERPYLDEVATFSLMDQKKVMSLTSEIKAHVQGTQARSATLKDDIAKKYPNLYPDSDEFRTKVLEEAQARARESLRNKGNQNKLANRTIENEIESLYGWWLYN
ncbi:MAG: hypothetical protein HYS98_05650 [Deltaproteobacteria bacterium]|nr:hypothetical protein [Deltaproteobacteria bacterium]